MKETSNSQTRGSRQLDSGDRLARDETTEQSYSTLTLVDFASGVSRLVLASAAWCRGLSLLPSGAASPQHTYSAFFWRHRQSIGLGRRRAAGVDDAHRGLS